MEVGLAELAPVGIERDPSAELDGAIGNESRCLTAPTKAQRLELEEDEWTPSVSWQQSSSPSGSEIQRDA